MKSFEMEGKVYRLFNVEVSNTRECPRMTFCMLLKSDRHFTGFAVAGDLEEGGAGFQVEVVGEGRGVFAF